MIRTWQSRLWAGVLAVILIAGLAVPAAAVDQEPIRLEPSALSLEEGQSGTLTATVSDALKDCTLEWSSDAKEVADVEPAVTAGVDGSAVCTVKAVKAGDATITVTAKRDGQPEAAAQCKVQVTAPKVPVTDVQITTPVGKNIVEAGGALQLTAIVYPENATNKALTWSSDSSGVATVDKDGRVAGVAPGKATIQVTTVDGGKQDQFDVECSGISLSASNLKLFVNESKSLSFPLYGAASGKQVEWSSSNISVADVSGGRITGRNPGTATITATVYGTGYSASCSVTVEEDLAGAIQTEVEAGQVCGFSQSEILSELDDWCDEKTGGRLEYVTGLRVATGQGVLYYGYVSPDAHGHGVGGTERYYRRAGGGQNSLAEISFVPRSDFDGTAVISYTGVADNGRSFQGTIRVEVEKANDVSYSTAEGRPLEFSSSDFAAVCLARTGRSIRHVTFEQPSSSHGTLYYKYNSAAEFSQRVDSGTKYYATSTPSIDLITFLPSSGYTGNVSVPYTCVDSSGGSYRGRVTITMYASGTSGAGDVEYTTGVEDPVTLDASDFNRVCQDANDKNFSYVRFELPRASEGTLYYDYTSANRYERKVSENERYYRSRSPRLSDVTFVPAKDFEGTVEISFRGVDTSEDPFSGRLVIRVTDDDRDGVVRYETGAGEPLTFDAADFNAACRRSGGAKLDRVTFEQPSSARGTLYYGYTSSGSAGSKVSPSTSYYQSGSPSISRVTFVPESGYTGTLSIPFRGYDVNGDRFDGSVRIEVGEEEGIVTYRADSGDVVDFAAADFNAACREITGENLSYVRFSIPAARYGTLYYKYGASSGESKLTASTSYYRTGSGRLLDDVSFQAADGYSGTVSIDYDGRSVGGTAFSGMVDIVLARKEPTPPRWEIDFVDVPASAYYHDAVQWAVNAGITGGTTPNTFSPGVVCTRAQTVTFLWRASGSPAPKSGVNPFRDVSHSAYYYDAVLWAVEQGITSGTTKTTFSPDAVVDRGQAVTFLYKHAGAPVSGGGNPFSDVKNGDYFAPAVRWASIYGITTGTGGTTFSPKAACTRAQIITFLYKKNTLLP